MKRYAMLFLFCMGMLCSTPGRAAVPAAIGTVVVQGSYLAAAAAASLLSHATIDHSAQKVAQYFASSPDKGPAVLSEEAKTALFCFKFAAGMACDALLMRLLVGLYGPAVMMPWAAMVGKRHGTCAKIAHVGGSILCSVLGFTLKSEAGSEAYGAWQQKTGRVKNFCKALAGGVLSLIGNCWLGSQLGANAVQTRDQVIQTVQVGGVCLVAGGFVGSLLLAGLSSFVV